MQTHPNKGEKMMGQQQQETVAGSSVLRRTILALLVAALVVATMAASAMPAFANSFASDSNKSGIGPNGGNNFGHCKPGDGTNTAESSPSYNGGPLKNIDTGNLC
jgi:hypothetical protein